MSVHENNSTPDSQNQPGAQPADNIEANRDTSQDSENHREPIALTEQEKEVLTGQEADIEERSTEDSDETSDATIEVVKLEKPKPPSNATEAFNKLSAAVTVLSQQINQQQRQLDEITKVVLEEKKKTIDSLCDVHDALCKRVHHDRRIKGYPLEALTALMKTTEGKLNLHGIKSKSPNPGDSINLEWMKVIGDPLPATKKHLPNTVAKVMKYAYYKIETNEKKHLLSKTEVIAYK